ncbi:MAG TPA: RNA pseudouridine synthase [Bacillota bacterium]|nr:RNA pseudouridine synthase [Bacillota bacterium]
MHVPILYEDNHLLAVAKPVNIPVQKDRSKDKDLLTFLKDDLKVRYNKPGNVFLALVHRLDRPVGGAMVFAKTSKAASRLSDTIRRGAFNRKYLAVVRGVPEEKEAELTHYLYKNKRKNQVYTVDAYHKNAKKAVLDYRVIDQAEQLSLLGIRLHTGRPHQIRVQLSASGMPIYGDQKYAPHLSRPGQQIALWSHALSFKHPTRDDVVQVVSHPPQDYPWRLWPKEVYNVQTME